ncbi:hypothetical protein H6G32_24610 [Cylindrospermum sp. FACHB-282]|nr:hypothetical protein [Cylindrospermum sp. FACHB-282]
MRLTPLKTPPQGWKNLLFSILLVFTAGNYWCWVGIHGVWAANSEKSAGQGLRPTVDDDRQNPVVSQKTSSRFLEVTQQSSEFLPVYSAIEPNIAPATPLTAKPNASSLTDALGDTQQHNHLPQIEMPPRDLPKSSLEPIEQRLNPPQIGEFEKIERLRRRLQKQKQLSSESNSSQELGLRIRRTGTLAQESPTESNSNQELGLRIRPRTLEQLPPPSTEKPVAEFKPIGYLKANVGYFQTSNIFSANDRPIEDGLIFSGLTLASGYFPLGAKTYLNGSIDGNLIRYIDQSKYDYNQLRFNLGIYQQLSPRMYGEIGWSNQQLFFAKNGDRSDSIQAGDRFLNETALRLSLGRRDPLTQRLFLDSFYELSVNFSDPQSRSRVVNSGGVSLSYYLQKPLNIGINYQLNLSDFTQRQREDQFHRLFGHLNYRISNSSNLNLQTGVTLGGSTVPNIDFSGWFFSANYNLELGRF